jgi:glycosyltransferase involved in cell wall biosynthesis
MSKIIHLPFVGSPTGGGPHVFVYKFAQAVQKRGYKVIYDKPNRADVVLCIIETGRVLKKINRQKTKVVLRIDGAYFKEYWHGGPGREWRSDMNSLHNKLKTDIPSVDHVIFQSLFSMDRINKEIIKRQDRNWSIIHNGVDINLFKPVPRSSDQDIVLFHIGKVRDGYIMESLIFTYKELKKRGHSNIKLKIAGNMDAECINIYNQYKSDPDISYLGVVPNTMAPKLFNQGDIYLAPRMGSSSDNVIPEALASGLPTILPRWGGNAEIISNSKEGIIVDSGGHWNYGPDYVKKLADGVEKIIPDLNNYKIRARKHACTNLNLDIMVDKYLKAMGI